MKKYFFTAIALILILNCTELFAQVSQANNDDSVVTTQSGKVKGRLLNGLIVFKSILYTAPPVGEYYFAIPAPHPPWQGIRDATKQGPTAPFPKQEAGDIDDTPTIGEGWIKGNDFLTTNVWTPATGDKHLPVMVYIHGGAFVIGTTDVPLFDGTAFAKKGVVMVSLYYRMGIVGFLKIPGVLSNLGIRDQIAALKWVQDNIAAFGGAKDNVTVFGESAGAISVEVLIASPAVKRLFKRCIMQSGSGQAALSGEQADRIATQYAKTLNIKNNRES